MYEESDIKHSYPLNYVESGIGFFSVIVAFCRLVMVAKHISVTLPEITLRLLTLGDGWGKKPVSW